MVKALEEMLADARAKGFAEGLEEVRKENEEGIENDPEIAEIRRKTERERERAEKAEKELAELKARYERKKASII